MRCSVVPQPELFLWFLPKPKVTCSRYSSSFSGSFLPIASHYASLFGHVAVSCLVRFAQGAQPCGSTPGCRLVDKINLIRPEKAPGPTRVAIRAGSQLASTSCLEPRLSRGDPQLVFHHPSSPLTMATDNMAVLEQKLTYHVL